MKPPGRIWLWLGLALGVLVVVTAVLQAVNNLLWQLSYLLPSWLVGPFSLLLFGGAALLIARFAWPWFNSIRRSGWKVFQEPGSRTSAPIEAPVTRKEAAQKNLAGIETLLQG
ncbi:MAG: GTP-binding protein, partial [Vulcanococcus sp.]